MLVGTVVQQPRLELCFVETHSHIDVYVYMYINT